MLREVVNRALDVGIVARDYSDYTLLTKFL
jgi:hypothetical protein